MQQVHVCISARANMEMLVILIFREEIPIFAVLLLDASMPKGHCPTHHHGAFTGQAVAEVSVSAVTSRKAHPPKPETGACISPPKYPRFILALFFCMITILTPRSRWMSPSLFGAEYFQRSLTLGKLDARCPLTAVWRGSTYIFG
jgi:hypothetical protein